MRHRIIRGLAVAALGLPILLAAPIGVAAGPPVREVNGLAVDLDENCLASITWEPLQGGRPMFAKVLFSHQASDGGYDLFLGDDGITFHKVQQNDGQLDVDLAGVAATEPDAPNYKVEVHFEDRKGNLLSGVEMNTSTCLGV